jgi:ABC-type multidrug transport system ATPase subunit
MFCHFRDECTSGVDPIAAENIISYLQYSREACFKYNTFSTQNCHNNVDNNIDNNNISNNNNNNNLESYINETDKYDNNQETKQQPQQCLLFSSHRLDECMSICNRVILLNQGNIIFDGPIESFHNISSFFYQIDLIFPLNLPLFEENNILFEKNINYSHSIEFENEKFIKIMLLLFNIQNLNQIERIVQYSETKFRITLEKEIFPVSTVIANGMHLIETG